MISQKQIIEKLTQDRIELERYKVNSLSLFGSFAKGIENKKSDIDLLVSFQSPVGLFEFIQLREHLETVLDSPIDLVTKESLHPHLKDKILKETIHVI